MKLIATMVAAAFAASAFAQDKPAATPAPSWHGGKPPAMAESTLHPFAPLDQKAQHVEDLWP